MTTLFPDHQKNTFVLSMCLSTLYPYLEQSKKIRCISQEPCLKRAQRVEYSRLYRRIFVLFRVFVRFTKCRIQIKNVIGIFLHLQRGIDPVSKDTAITSQIQWRAFQRKKTSLIFFTEFIQMSSRRDKAAVEERSRVQSWTWCFLEGKSHVHSMRSLKPAECHEECKQKRNHHMIVATQI